MKETTHKYNGFTIKGTSYWSGGVQVLGGRHWTQGGLKREYKIFTDEGKPYMDKYLLRTLSDAKKEIDDCLKMRQGAMEKLKWYKERGASMESLIDKIGLTKSFIEKYYSTI